MTSKYQLLDDFYLKLSNKYDSAIKGEHILFNGDSAINEIEKLPSLMKMITNLILLLLLPLPLQLMFN